MSFLTFQPLEDMSVTLGLSTLNQGLQSDGTEKRSAESYLEHRQGRQISLAHGVPFVGVALVPYLLSRSNHLSKFNSEPKNHDVFSRNISTEEAPAREV
jgi:hypothetical protein